MKSLQDWVYDLEDGPLRVWMVRIALFLIVVGLSSWIGLREFNGLRTFEAMDLAQQARQLAEGKGFTTLLIRPLALWQIRANLGNQAPPVTAFPESLSQPLYPLVLAGCFKVALVSRLISFELSSEALKSFRLYPPDLVVLGLQLVLLVATTFLVYSWAHRQFDVGTGVLAVVFFLGSSPLWNQAVSGGEALLNMFLYALAGWFFCQGCCRDEEAENSGAPSTPWPWYLGAGLALGATALVQLVQIWVVLTAFGLAWVILRRGSGVLAIGLLVGVGCFVGWLVRLWWVTRNPIGLNWGFLLADSARFPGEAIWRTYTFDMEKTDIWRRLGGAVLRGSADLISQGPALVGNAVPGTLALLAGLHAFRRSSAAAGRNLWGGVAVVLIFVTAFVQRAPKLDGHAILMGLLPAACVYGAAYLWIVIERWRLHLELLGRLFAILVGLVAVWPTFARLLLPEPAPFAYPPTYPPIFLFMKSWFEPGEFQASDLPAAEAWYAEQPTLWLPMTREDFLKIHDRVSPVFSILLTPASSDVRMYSQMLSENSEWREWADLIRRQKPPSDLPQAFATSLPPNNEYLLLSIQKRWN